jgi:hypothetical protein
MPAEHGEDLAALQTIMPSATPNFWRYARCDKL